MDPNVWKPFVHSTYWDSATCCYLDEDGSSAFISTKEGAFLEFHKGVLERSCLMNCIQVESIEQFFAYHPYIRYFLLKDSGKLVVVRDQEELKVVQVHTGVQVYEIGDFNGEGTAQVKIRFFDESKEPVLVNFSDFPSHVSKTVTNQNQDFLCGRLQRKLKETKDILANFIKEVENKRKLCKETMQRLARSHAPESSHPPAGLEHFLGKVGDEDFFQTPTEAQPMQICHHWQTTANEKWLLGVVIRNGGDRNVSKLKVFLQESPKQRICYSVKRLNSTNMDGVLERLKMKTPQMLPSPVSWREEQLDSDLLAGNGCVLICVLPFPEFTLTSNIHVSGRLSYSIGSQNEVDDIHSQQIPSFEITTRSVLNSSLLPESLHKNFLQTITTIAVFESVMLTVTTGILSSNKSVEDVLTVDIGFSPTHEDSFFIHTGLVNSMLGGCLVQVIHLSEGFEVIFYARAHKILHLLVFCFVEACHGSWSIKHGPDKSPDALSHMSSSSLDDCSDALSKEMHYIIYKMSKWEKNDSANQLSIGVESYAKFRNEVRSLQKRTDMVFSGFQLEYSKGDHIIYY